MKINNCRLCNGKLSEPKINLGSTPLANEFLSEKIEQETFPLEVCVCESCQHYQLNESIDPEKLFRHYVFVAGTSPVNVQHFKNYAEHMVEKFSYKPGDKVLDIASNDGTLLQHFKNLEMKGLGIDPAKNIAEIANNNGIETIAEFFTESYADTILEKYGKFDLITANNVFAHVPDMIGFAKGVKKLLADQGVFSFEVSYFGDVCDDVLFDTIYHEHSSYHTITPLISFFKSHGLHILDVEKITNHGGSVRIFVINSENIENNRLSSEDYWCPLDNCRKWHSKYLHFNNTSMLTHHEENISEKVIKLQKDIKYLGLELREILNNLYQNGKTIAAYGVPAKATTLTYALKIDENLISFAVDDNPLKQNTFTPGKHIPVYGTDKLFKDNPDYILILAWNFAESIVDKCKKQGYSGKFIIPLPELKVL